MLKRAVSSFALVIGLTALACGGGQRPASEPSPTSDGSESTTEPASASHAGESSQDVEPDTQSGASSSAESATNASPEKTSDDTAPTKCRESAAKLALAVEKQSIDLDRGVLEATMDGPICKITMTLTRTDGQKVETNFSYTGARRELKWNPIPRDQIETIEIRISAADNAYQAVKVVPWSVNIDHKEVVFDSDKADIRPSEVPALDDSLAKIKEVLQKVQNKGFGTVTLFVADHTDTRSNAERNLDLSRRRAQSISGWFKKRGLCVPIAYDGFGETILKKVTADEVDEQANRRVDYILAVEPPAVGKGARPAWKWISKGC